MTAEELAAIHASAFTDQRPWSAEEFAALLSSPHVFLSAGAQGFALGRAIAGEAELLTLAVSPAAQGQGAGRQILESFHRNARQRHATETFLEVAAANERAIRLYESAGYFRIAERPDYYTLTNGQRVAALVYRRALGT